ncbi:MAG: maleylacetoacetate isomerase [Bdellovibrionales bacterium]|nr:maleylacetoacetate isomerase [Bdellovibrionales bacterium]
MILNEEAPMKLKLYSYWRSSCSYRVRIALYFKGIDFIYMPIHLVKDGGQQHHANYLKINPSKTVPTLMHGEVVINQSMSIFHFLDEMWPEPHLFPLDHYEKAQIMDICEVINSGIQPIQNLGVNQELTQRFNATQEDIASWNKEFITRGFNSIEYRLKDCSKDFCFGNTVTAADMFLIPQVYNALRFEVDMKSYPNIYRINENCLQRSEFIKASPDQQPDAQIG